MSKYKVKARWWHEDFQSRFGNEYSIHNLSDSDVVQLIMEFGRAHIDREVQGEDVIRTLDFQNDYD